MKKKPSQKKAKIVAKKPEKKVEKKWDKVRPVGDRVLVQPTVPETMTASGIIIPDTANKEKPEQGIVVAVGTGKEVKVGDKVMFSRYGFEEIKVDGIEYYILKEENILAILN